MNKFLDSPECPMCKTGAGHCYGDENYCTCSCRIVKAKQIVKEYLFKDTSNIKMEYRSEFQIDPNAFIERIINTFYGEGNYENNKEMYLQLFQYLESFTNGDNLNTRESRIKPR